MSQIVGKKDHTKKICRSESNHIFEAGTKVNEDQDILYLIDFGTSTRYKSLSNVHINPGNSDRIVGTCRYAAIRMHFGHYQSRRDDLESLGYVLLYLYYGNLPWQDVKHKDAR